MAELHFAKPCTYTAPDGTQRAFAPGRYADVPDDIAGHWFVKAHLVQDGEESLAPETAPLQHEERVKVKAALDAVEGRARGAEAERDAAVSRAEALQADLDAERAAHAETRRRLDEATAPEGATDADDADEFAGKVHTVKRGQAGSYKVVKGDEIVAEGLKKAEAEARARELNGQG